MVFVWRSSSAVFSYTQASFIVGLICSYFLAGWRVALGVQCLFGVILIIGMIFLPETPRWEQLNRIVESEEEWRKGSIFCLLNYNAHWIAFLLCNYKTIPSQRRWLVKKHRDEKASRVLVRLRRTSPNEVKEELEEIQASVKESEMGGARAWWWAWRALLRWKIVERYIYYV